MSRYERICNQLEKAGVSKKPKDLGEAAEMLLKIKKKSTVPKTTKPGRKGVGTKPSETDGLEDLED